MKERKLSLFNFFSRRSVEPALDQSVPLRRRHAGLAPRARVGVEDALLHGLVDLLGGLMKVSSERERKRKQKGEFWSLGKREKERGRLAAVRLFSRTFPLPFFRFVSSPRAALFSQFPYLGDEYLDGLDVVLGGGNADGHESLEDLSIGN